MNTHTRVVLNVIIGFDFDYKKNNIKYIDMFFIDNRPVSLYYWLYFQPTREWWQQQHHHRRDGWTYIYI